MIKGILDSFRKDLGFTQSGFRNHPSYEECHTIARELVR